MNFFATILSLLFCSFSILIAQSKDPKIIIKLQQPEKGDVKIIQDARINEMIAKFSLDNEIKKTVRGFRIKIFSISSVTDARKLTFEAKERFMQNFPNDETYVEVKAPDWNLYVGNYRTLTDAHRAKKSIEKIFPNLSIVEADIDVTKL